MDEITPQKILIVDDVADNIKILTESLKSEYKIYFALNGTRALELAQNKLPDLILLDILMPDMDGYQVCNSLKSNPTTKHIPIIFVSAKSTIDDETKGLKLGAVDYIKKPYHLPIIKVRISNILALVNQRKCLEKEIVYRTQAEKELQKSLSIMEEKVAGRTKDYKEAKETAERANKLKSEFLANMSHELRTPMHHILSYSRFGVDKINTETREKLLTYFSTIRSSGKNLLSLLNDLLDLSKLESGKMNYDLLTIDLKQIVSNISKEFTTLLKEKGVILKIENNSIPTEINCDELKIGQVIRNLLSNAIKFTPKEEIITVSFEACKFKLTDADSIPALCVKISDRGLGLPSNELDSIFDKFIQSSKTNTGSGGTGLGLSICKEIIQAHEGKIWAENNLESGSTFSFMLPVNIQ